MARAMGFYRYHHIERGTGMILKTVGLPPRGRLSDLMTKGAWHLLRWRRNRFEQQLRAA
jgi:hypothetical protein